MSACPSRGFDGGAHSGADSTTSRRSSKGSVWGRTRVQRVVVRTYTSRMAARDLYETDLRRVTQARTMVEWGGGAKAGIGRRFRFLGG